MGKKKFLSFCRVPVIKVHKRILFSSTKGSLKNDATILEGGGLFCYTELYSSYFRKDRERDGSKIMESFIDDLPVLVTSVK